VDLLCLLAFLSLCIFLLSTIMLSRQVARSALRCAQRSTASGQDQRASQLRISSQARGAGMQLLGSDGCFSAAAKTAGLELVTLSATGCAVQSGVCLTGPGLCLSCLLLCVCVCVCVCKQLGSAA